MGLRDGVKPEPNMGAYGQVIKTSDFAQSPHPGTYRTSLFRLFCGRSLTMWTLVYS